ncbi:MAG: hypothetical protein ABI896_05700 [Actinomycetota bacterium]
MENGDTWEGTSEDGFKAAAADAVEKYERDRGIPEEPVRLKIIEMYVTVHNPIHDYRVILGPGS